MVLDDIGLYGIKTPKTEKLIVVNCVKNSRTSGIMMI
jgi:hypothetical protein